MLPHNNKHIDNFKKKTSLSSFRLQLSFTEMGVGWGGRKGGAHFAWHARGGCGEINGLFENGWGRKQVDSAVVS